jgi:uncharacterized protein (TIGR00106 family)
MPASAPSKVIADVSIYPIGVGTSLSKYVQAAFRAMGKVPGIRLVPGAMSTVVEGPDLATVFLAVQKAHDAQVEMGGPRIAIYLRVDHRLDKPETIEYKVGRVTADR